MTRDLLTQDYLVFAKLNDSRSLAIMKDCPSAQDAVEIYNEQHDDGPRAKHAVRISTFEGTLTHLITLQDPATLRWARDDDGDNAKLAREIAKELGVKLPKKK